jgi:hypothetical protein
MAKLIRTSAGLGVDTDSNSLTTNEAGEAEVKTDPAGGLEQSESGLAVKVDPAGGLEQSESGLAVKVDGVTVAVNESGALETLAAPVESDLIVPTTTFSSLSQILVGPLVGNDDDVYDIIVRGRYANSESGAITLSFRHTSPASMRCTYIGVDGDDAVVSAGFSNAYVPVLNVDPQGAGNGVQFTLFVRMDCRKRTNTTRFATFSLEAHEDPSSKSAHYSGGLAITGSTLDLIRLTVISNKTILEGDYSAVRVKQTA